MKIDKGDRLFIGVGVFIFLLLIVAGIGSFSLNSSDSTSTGGATNSTSTNNVKSEAKAEVTKTHWTAYTNSIDTNWAIITGVIKNTGKTNVRLSQASGTVYDVDGKVVGNSSSSIYPSIIAPNEEAYVAIQIMDTVDKEEIKDAKIQIEFDETNEEPIRLNAINDSGRKTSYDYEVAGELENTTNKEVKNARALVLFFDKDNNFINAETAYPTPETISPQGKVAFKASTSHLDEIVSSYKVIGFPTQWGF